MIDFPSGASMNRPIDGDVSRPPHAVRPRNFSWGVKPPTSMTALLPVAVFLVGMLSTMVPFAGNGWPSGSCTKTRSIRAGLD
jgi:hypothetical protein